MRKPLPLPAQLSPAGGAQAHLYVSSQVPASHLRGPLLLFLLGVGAAEWATTYGHPQGGMLLHGLLLVSIFPVAALGLNGPAQKFLYTLALAPLIRLVSLSMPLATFQATYWYAIIGIPLLLSAYLIWRLTGLRRESIGLSLGVRWLLQILVGLSGLALGYLEYQILEPQPLVPEFSLAQVWAPALILLAFTGFLEEFIFRGLMQAAAAPVLRRLGVLYVSLLFAALHLGYQSAIDVVFVFLVGLYFALVVERTRSLLGVTLAHALTNIALFLIVPYL